MDPVTDVGVAVAAEAATWSLAKVIKHIGYLYKYKENLESLQVAAEQLDAKRSDARRFAQDTDRRQRDVSNDIANWRPEADKLYDNAQDMISTNAISCLRPWSRYSTSKNASEMAKQINEKVQAAAQYFGTTFDRQPHKLGDKFDLKGFKEFKSRASVLDDIWKNLKDEKVRICSICGMGGTGKTTLVKKLIQRVQTNSLFDKVAMTTISQNSDLTKIRRDIVSTLGWKFKSEELETSDKLMDCLMNNDGSILLVLDDVWEKLDFEEIGLPKEKLKILMTSRRIGVCQSMESQPNFVINVLNGEETWHMFEEITIESIEMLKLHDTARNIADECGGLPIVIATLAAALKHENKATWNDSLLKLKNSNLRGISGMEKVYSRIRLSYDLLNDEEAKSCFRLCCLFPEDANVGVEYLMWLGKGLQFFNTVESMSETRNRVESIIHKLKKSFLLLDGDDDGTVKMHDILRDFAISISSEDKHPYIVGCGKIMEKWPYSSMYENCSAISIICDKIKEHPVRLSCPKLELLQLRVDEDRHPIRIFEELKELKVLILEGSSSLLQSLTVPRKLRTLIISDGTGRWNQNAIGDLLGHEDMKSLEILLLSFLGWYDNLPKEIGQLCNLRYLNFGNMKFEYVPPGVFSKLVNLEELVLPEQLIRWGCKEEEGERVNARLDEIESLPLTSLEIILYDSSLAEKLLKTLTRFCISVGRGERKCNGNASASARVNVFNVDTCDIPVSWLSCLMSKCELLELKEVVNLKNIMFLLSAEEHGFPRLKYIFIDRCREMEYLVDTITAPCFSNLCRMKIEECWNIKRLFPLSVARQLRQLQSIVISNCYEMEEIFYRDQVEDDYAQEVAASSIQSVQLITTSIVETPTTPTMLNSNIPDDKTQVICCPTTFIQCLRGKQKQPKMVPSQQSAEESIAKADEKRVDRAIRDLIIFPQLESLRLTQLPKLRIFYDGNHGIELPSLQVVDIVYCHTMEVLSLGSIKSQSLEGITINWMYYPMEGDNLNTVMTKRLAIENEVTWGRIREIENDNDADDIHS